MISPKITKYSYGSSGVNIEEADKFVSSISKLTKQNLSSQQKQKQADVLAAIGGFASLYQVPQSFKDPVIASAVDGVGTKLALAQDEDDYICLGIDLVAMCVNDLICCGAEPHLFFDYYATGQLEKKQAAALIEGITQGCQQANCLLAGGETAEMPGLYDPDKFDLAGFALGFVEKEAIISPQTKRNDFANTDDLMLLGIKSNGVHANGFSLVRKLLADGALPNHTSKPYSAKTFMRPTKIYVPSLLEAIKNTNVLGIAHITGGGITDNLPRALPNGYRAEVSKEKVFAAGGDLFRDIQKAGKIKDDEMLRTFNCGIGMVIIHPAEDTEALTEIFAAAGEEAVPIGKLSSIDDTKGSSSDQPASVLYV